MADAHVFERDDTVKLFPSPITDEQRRRLAELDAIAFTTREQSVEWATLMATVGPEDRMRGRLGTGVYRVLDILPVAPGDQRLAGHSQRLLINFPDGRRDWISAAWFVPAGS